MLIPRVGVATDVHAFADPNSDRQMWLACLPWPGEPALEGHSDADVVAHAVADALLAAAGLGDLGSNFGTDRPEWAGASGRAFLQQVAGMLDQARWQIGNVSVQVIGNRPRMAGRYAECNRAVSQALGGADVHVTATTSDRLGFTGRDEGVAAVATALIYPKMGEEVLPPAPNRGL
ncbi:MAG: 2-C-methyl-D-erythritol 2,4-cyclodiphosphate synthase [Actinomycetaceae bacterium]|nr:2-C-methyl-D-erythritol 2,4-cyclodiphosphate synthase [Actinomycetaceae bacterium]